MRAAALWLAAALPLPRLVWAELPVRPCPAPTLGRRSPGDDDNDEDREEVNVVFSTRLPVGVDIFWVDAHGKEVAEGSLQAEDEDDEDKLRLGASHGDVFRIYANASGARVLLQEFEARRRPRRQAVEIVGCGAVEEALRAARSMPRERAAEFEALAHPGPDASGTFPPCQPEGSSERWSCVRHWPAEACARRHRNDPVYAGKDAFGYRKAKKTPDGVLAVGTFEDADEDEEWAMANVIGLSNGPGFLKMTVPASLRSKLSSWYSKQEQAGKIKDEAPGVIRNSEEVVTGYVHLENDLRHELDTEVGQILGWWTNWTALRHTTTYGVRVYRRGSVLLNHMDKSETHLASAIVQVHQEVDADGGWPVEIIAHDQSCYEVFLQPGEMLLYEGARFKHGRPMIFRGSAFANIFTHFAPIGWRSPREGDDDDDEQGRDNRRDKERDEL